MARGPRESFGNRVGQPPGPASPSPSGALPGPRTRLRPDRRGRSDMTSRRRPGVPPHVRSRRNAVSPSASPRAMAYPERRFRASMCRVTAAWDVARPDPEATSPEFEPSGRGRAVPPLPRRADPRSRGRRMALGGAWRRAPRPGAPDGLLPRLTAPPSGNAARSGHRRRGRPAGPPSGRTRPRRHEWPGPPSRRRDARSSVVPCPRSRG